MVDGPNLYVYVRDNPMLYVDNTGNAATLTVKDAVVTVNLNLVLYPSELLVKQNTTREFIRESIAPRIKESIEKTWSGQNFELNGATYTFQVNVAIHIASTETEAEDIAKLAGKFGTRSDVVKLDILPKGVKEFRSNVSNTDIAKTYSRGSTWDLFPKSKLVYAHEAGHLMGLSDDYFEEERKSRPGNVATGKIGLQHLPHMMGEHSTINLSTNVINREGGSVAEHELIDIIINNRIDLLSSAPQVVGNFNVPQLHPSRLPDPNVRLEDYRRAMRQLHPDGQSTPSLKPQKRQLQQ